MAMKLATSALLFGSATAFSTLQSPARATIVQSRARPVVAASPLAPGIWDMPTAVRVQGDTLKTWDIGEETTERVQVSIKSDGRPIEAAVQLWHTPAYIPAKFKVYTMDGKERPVDTIIETPKHPKTVAVYNTASVDFPFDATCANTGLGKAYESLAGVEPDLLQGAGKIQAYTFGPEVDSVQVMLRTAELGERNMDVKIELTQGPNMVKQIIELYCSSGYKNPFYFVIQTPGANNAIRIINQYPVEFPVHAWCLPYETNPDASNDPIMSSI